MQKIIKFLKSLKNGHIWRNMQKYFYRVKNEK